MLKVEDFTHKGFERVVRGVDETTGLNAIVAIHNTVLGPALGGCRVMEYPSTAAQVTDVMNLARGMTYKSALAGNDLGGGKSTINHPSGQVTPDMWKSFGEFLNVINDREHLYTAAGDIGSSNSDLAILAEHTPFVQGFEGSDSGIATAYGVFQAATGAMRLRGIPYSGSKFSVIGLGKVGLRLVNFLIRAGVNPSDIYVTDVDQEKVTLAMKMLGVKPTTTEDAHIGIDVVMPCAVGGYLTEELIDDMFLDTIVCGAANNQLADETLNTNGILYVPDYLANAGGVIIISKRHEDEYFDLEYDDPEVLPRLEALADKAWDVLHISRQTGRTTHQIANELAEERFNV